MFKVVTVAVLSSLATAGLVDLGVLSPAGVAVIAVLALVVVLLERTHRQASWPARGVQAGSDRDLARTVYDLRALGVTAGGAPSRLPALPTL